jgi:hypothetical protein
MKERKERKKIKEKGNRRTKPSKEKKTSNMASSFSIVFLCLVLSLT